MNYAHLNPKSPPTFHNQITSDKKNHEKITQETHKKIWPKPSKSRKQNTPEHYKYLTQQQYTITATIRTKKTQKRTEIDLGQQDQDKEMIIGRR